MVADLEQVSDIVSMVDSFLKIEDYSDFDSAQAGYDGLVDEALLQADREHAAVSFFAPEGQDPADAVAFLTQQFEQAGLHNQICSRKPRTPIGKMNGKNITTPSPRAKDW